MHEQASSDRRIQEVLARVRGLAGHKRRQAEGCFWVEGVRNFVRAFDARWNVETILHSPVLLKSDLAEMLIRRFRRIGVQRIRISPEQFRSVCTLPWASGIGAIVRQRWTPLRELDPHEGLCTLAIERIRSPGNLGTILRTAEACGVGAVIFVGPEADPYHPAVVRASMGGLMNLQLVRTSPRELGRWAASRGVHIIGLTPDAAGLWACGAIEPPIVLALGEEQRGLSAGLRGIGARTASLPMAEGTDSLNVAVAAGVMMYELMRQRVEVG